MHNGAKIYILIYWQLSAPYERHLPFTPALTTRITKALQLPPRHCRISITKMQIFLQALSLLSAYNTLHSDYTHISSDYAKKIFRILHASNYTNIRTRASVWHSTFYKRFASVLPKKVNSNTFLQRKPFQRKKAIKESKGQMNILRTTNCRWCQKRRKGQFF